MRIYDEFRDMDAASPIAIEVLVLELIAQTSRIRTSKAEIKPEHWLARARDLIHAHFSEQLSLNKFAETVEMHPVHVARAFRQHYHCAIGEYVRKLQVEFPRQAIMTLACRLFFDSPHSPRIHGKGVGMRNHS